MGKEARMRTRLHYMYYKYYIFQTSILLNVNVSQCHVYFMLVDDGNTTTSAPMNVHT